MRMRGDPSADIAYVKELLSYHFACMNQPYDGCTLGTEVADYLGVEWREDDEPTFSIPEGVTFDT